MSEASQLSTSVFAVKVDGSYILLDAPKDRYLFLTPRQSSWLDDILLHSRSATALTQQARHFAETLRQQSLLTSEGLIFPRACMPVASCAYDSWHAAEVERHSAATPPLLLRMTRAVGGCWWLERQRNFAGVVSEVSRWKARCNRNPAQTEAAVRAELTAFRKMTPLFFTSRDACRFRSLVLMKFLIAGGIIPDWVFAVRLAPFAAHCWVEWEGHVLNEHFDRTQDYCEIMRV